MHQLLRLFESLLQAVGAVLEAAAHGTSTGGESSLVEGHQEADGAGARVVVLGRGAGALAFHEAGDLAVELELIPIDGEVHRVRDALSEDLARFPGAVLVALGEVDHRLFRAPQVEGRPLLGHGLLDGAHVGVGVSIQKLQEEGEVDRIAPVRRGGHQEEMVRSIAQQLSQFVAQALVRLVARGHAVSFVHDHEIPLHLAQTGQDLVALGQVQRSDDLLLLHPLVDAELIAQITALEDEELFVELLLELALPLEGEIGRCDDEDPLRKATQLQLADQETRHDRLARARVVGEQEAHPGELEQMVVDRFQLVGQRIDTRDRKPEIGVELPGNPERVGLETEAQELAIASIGKARFLNRE